MDSVKEALKSKGDKGDGDLVWNILFAMRSNHMAFATACLQVLQMPVSNVDCERGFSAYGDILTTRRNRLSTANTEAMICIYFGEGEEIITENLD